MLKILTAATLLLGVAVLAAGLAPARIRLRGVLHALGRPLGGARRPAAARGRDMVRKTDEQWRRELTPEQYRVMRGGATEPPFSGRFWDHHEEGTYLCAGCGAGLFGSDAKLDGGSGWPTYFAPIDGQAVGELADISQGTVRTGIICRRCESHLGHVFRDGPRPTGLRYRVNSAALDFVAADGGRTAVRDYREGESA